MYHCYRILTWIRCNSLSTSSPYDKSNLYIVHNMQNQSHPTEGQWKGWILYHPTFGAMFGSPDGSVTTPSEFKYLVESSHFKNTCVDGFDCGVVLAHGWSEDVQDIRHQSNCQSTRGPQGGWSCHRWGPKSTLKYVTHESHHSRPSRPR